MLFKKILKTAAVFMFVMTVSVSVAFAADDAVLTVGSATLNEKEILQMLAGTVGGNDMMVGMMLSQSTLKDRVALVNQMADAVIFAEAAKSKGLESHPDVAFQIKWQTIQLLIQAYFQEAGTKWDMGNNAMKKYYDTHLGEFVQAPAAHTRHILCNTEADAVNAVLEIYRTKDFAKVAADYSRDPNTAQNGGDLGWVEKGTMDPAVDEAIEKARVGSLAGPVKSGFGWHVIEVLERRPQKQLTFKEASEEVAQRLQRSYIDKELASLREKFKVEINEDSLSNLGGIPAAQPEAANPVK
ncbi:MAG: peptidylprolyl isomerase [Synergistaceae bacterium]|nr:peptidylprolyl isomerase [Synergistaceae bacterium]